MVCIIELNDILFKKNNVFVLFVFLTQHFFDNVVLNFSHFTTCTEVLTKQDFHGVSFFA